MPHIIQMGGAEYAKIGVENSSGTKLVSVSGNVQRPGNYEIELGISSREHHLRPRRRPARGARGEVLVPRRLVVAGADEGRPRHPLRLRLARQGQVDARLRRDHRRRRLGAGRQRRAEAREVLQARVLRQVHAVSRGHALDGLDARARRPGPRHADGPRHHGLRAGADHRQLPLRARRRDGDADRLDGREVPRRVRGPHRGRARRATRGPATRPADVDPVLIQGATGA